MRRDLLCRLSDIAQAEHPGHSLALVENRESTDLPALHGVNRLRDIISLPTTGDAFRHHVSGCEIRNILAVGYGSDGDIPIGDHSDQPVVLADRNATYVLLA